MRRLIVALLSVAALLGGALGAPAAGAAEPQGLTEGTPATVSGYRGRVDLAQRSIDAGRVAIPDATDRAAPDVSPRDTTSEPVFVQTTTAPPLATTKSVEFDQGRPGAKLGVAVGPEYVMMPHLDHTVMWRARDKAFGSGTWEAAASNLFDLPEGYHSDDLDVVYDPLRGRWIMFESSSTCDGNGDGAVGDPIGYVDILVSRTASILDPWDLYYFGWEGLLPTDVTLGMSSDKLTLSSNLSTMAHHEFCHEEVVFTESNILIMDTADVVTSIVPGGDGDIEATAISFADDDDYTAYRDPRVARSTPAGTATLFVVVQHLADTGNSLYFLKIGGSVVADTLTAGWEGDLTSLAEPLHAPLHVTEQAGRLTWVSDHSCLSPGDLSNRPCVRVTQIGVAGSLSSAPTGRQEFVIAEAEADLYGGGVAYALDGTLHVVWTRSTPGSDGDRPSTYAAYQRTSDPVNHLSAPQVIASGSGALNNASPSQWFDAIGIGPDPQVPDAVWTFTGVTKGPESTPLVLIQLQTGGATYVPIAPVRVLDSRSSVGVTGRFPSSQPKTFTVAGFASPAGSIPANAIAVTGNLTVTGQTAGGYVSVTSTPTSVPRSSTINVPFGDTRANNLTVPLSGSGKLSAVFKSGSGKTTDLILDITGYFLPGTEDAGYATMSPTRFLDTRAGTSIGLSGRFVSGVPRKLDVAGSNGVPADAVAVTANLTVLNQTRGGYVSVTTTSQPSPASSTINVPAGDVRANGLTAKLQGGDVWLVYKSSAGATTDLIVDITGYYRPAGQGLAFHALEPGRIMDTRTTAITGFGGKFKSGTPRKLLTDGHWGVPVGAKAISGNLTVVGQSGAGYVSATPGSDASPSTSTINFPVGDVRANGITVPLNVNGDQWFVYRSGSGATTHLLLDVTGYFQ